MFTVADKKKLEKAFARANELCPEVKLVKVGEYYCEYEVQGSANNLYTVTVIGNSTENIMIICECKTREGIACKHGVAALVLHLDVVTYLQDESH